MATQDVFAVGPDHDDSRVAYVLSPVTVLYFMTTLLCAFVFSPLLIPRIIPRYRVISRADKLLVNTLPGSAIHHITVPVLAIYAIVSGTISDRFYSTSPLGLALLQATLGYLVGDMIVYLCRKENYRKDTSMLVHHTVCIVSFTLILLDRGRGMFFAVSCQISEISSIFWVIVTGFRAFKFPKSSSLFKISGLLFMVFFFLLRVLVIPWHWYELISALMHPRSNTFSFPLKVYTCFHFVFINSINFYWFLLILKAVKRIKAI